MHLITLLFQKVDNLRQWGKIPHKGATKKQSEQIKSIIKHAEESNVEWQRRGEEPVPELEQGKSTSFVSCPSYDSCCPTSHPCCSSSPAYGFAVHNQWSPLVSASLVLSQGAHAGNITNAGMVYAGGSSPPPLIRAPEMSTHIRILSTSVISIKSNQLYAAPTGRFTIVVSVYIR